VSNPATKTVVVAEGWSALEPLGVWSDDSLTTLYIKITLASNTDTENANSGEIVIDAKGAAFERHPRGNIRCDLGSAQSETTSDWGDPSTADIKVSVPPELATARLLSKIQLITGQSK
jgi:hypothetical protein